MIWLLDSSNWKTGPVAVWRRQHAGRPAAEAARSAHDASASTSSGLPPTASRITRAAALQCQADQVK
jgi:hypothetical protein